MIKTLVSIEVDLAASRAIRFASQLNYLRHMEIYPVYVKETPPRELSIGSGWARHHWERELVQQGKAEIMEMISSEWEFSPTLKEPQVVWGDRDWELLKIMETEQFEVFVDGERFEWTPANLHRKLQSRLWQHFPGVIGIARVLRKIERLLVLCTEDKGVQPLVQKISHLWEGSSLPVALACPRSASPDLAQEAAKAKEVLAQAGCQVSFEADFPYFPELPAPGFLRTYGLVALALNRDLRKDSPELDWLSQIKAPLLITLY
ncbi:MAG: hypothetical protein C4567_14955 [Deltaproteobacteria bacterium]|nr:MAG: hypothetical protein C4567_14955 [Deltaproteobacteria bacterium]